MRPRRPTGKIVILDRGNVELAIPRGWTVKPDPAGFLKLEDPKEDCLLEVSYLRLPPVGPDFPPVEERLRLVMAEVKDAKGAEIRVIDHGATRAAWSDYGYTANDDDRRTMRAARGRWLIASNALFQVLMTFYYWVDDAGWTVPDWESIVRSLRLGDGSQLSSPFEHRTLRPKDRN